MLPVRVRTPSKMLPGMRGWLPAIIITAMVSPMARPTPRMIPARMPDLAAGTVTKNTLRSWLAPRAKAPS